MFRTFSLPHQLLDWAYLRRHRKLLQRRRRNPVSVNLLCYFYSFADHTSCYTRSRVLPRFWRWWLNVKAILLPRSGHQQGKHTVKHSTAFHAWESRFTTEGEIAVTQRGNRTVKVNRELDSCFRFAAKWNLQPTKPCRFDRNVR